MYSYSHKIKHKMFDFNPEISLSLVRNIQFANKFIVMYLPITDYYIFYYVIFSK